ncbi:unnamed protein product [Adineta steineri]|uniref:Nephrin-like protein n=1 Tax=Adineta steineri TaxID=433720 RepID=A0A815LPZ4_9BILA|nr:unnamed protein product [Adineta steineri]
MPLSLLIQLLIIYAILYLSNCDNQFYRIQPNDVSALVGSNITIPCVIALPHGDVQWTKDGLALGYDRQLPAFPTWSINGDENRGEFNFMIQSLKLEDEGVFACEVSPYKDAPALKQVAHIRALVQPQYVQIHDQSITNQSSMITVRYDETIHQVHCQVDGARPAAHIKWFNETGHEFPAASRTYTQNRLFSTTSTLTFVPSLLFDKKRFTCHVHHETLLGKINKLYTSIEIRITSPPNRPMIYGYTSTYRLLNGSYLTLSCQSFGGNPLGRLSWYRLDNEHKRLNLIDNSSIIFQQQNLTINNISMIITPSDNNMTYSCHVTNDYLFSLDQILQTNITVQVAFGPSFVYIRDNNMSATTLIEGTPRQFKCRTSSSNPRSIVTWKINGQILSPDIDPLEEPGEFSGTVVQITKTLGLDKSLKEYHKKILTCEARNPDTGHTVIDTTQLNVIYDATSIEMHGIIQDKIIKSGDTLTAECILKGGHPLGNIVWYKGGELLQSEYTTGTNGDYVTSQVKFIVSASDNNLPLTCKGQVDSFPQKFASFILNITFLPDEIMIIGNEFFSNLSINNDDSREFECRTSSSNPPAQLKITRQTNDGQKHLDIQYKKPKSLTNGNNSIKFMLPQIDLSLHGNLLTCEAILNIGTLPLTKQVTYVLNVNHKPYFHDSYTSIEVKENQSFNITLEANAYPMPITYKWYHPSGRQLMNDQLNIFVNQGQLALVNIQRNDKGIYRCIASNIIGDTETNFTLNILYGPMISRTQGYSLTEALMPGSSAILLCVIDANPINLNSIRWLKDNEEISSDHWEKRVEQNEISLIRKSVNREDAGQYVCEIDNQLGNSRATLPLIIQYAPEIDRTDPSRSKAAADADRLLTAEFHCHISAIPKPTVVWMKNNQVLPSSLKYQTLFNDRILSSSFSPNLTFEAILYVANVTKTDYGIYQCKAENKLGIDVSDIILTGLTVPDPPSQVEITNISHSSLLIHWIPGFDGGSQQTFQIRYRLSTDNRYSYIFIPFGLQSYDLKNLRLGSEYQISIRSNNSHHLSEWTNDIIKSTSLYLPSPSFSSSDPSTTKYSLTFLIIIFMIGLLIIFINIILVFFFVIKRRRSHVTSDNSSTTGTNETEANTVDIFQPIPSNFFLPTATATPINSYQKYEDDDIQRPFVSSYSAANMSNQDNTSSSNGIIKKNRYSPYDNFRVHHYYPANSDNNFVTYRSFKDGNNSSSDIHGFIKAELV